MNKKAEKIDKFFELSNEAFESNNESVYEDLGVSKEDYLNDKLKMIKRLKENLEGLILARSPQFQFRNIEKLDESDLKELFSDLNVIDIIENLENLDNAD